MPKPKLFMSYSSKDRTAAESLHNDPIALTPGVIKRASTAGSSGRRRSARPLPTSFYSSGRGMLQPPTSLNSNGHDTAVALRKPMIPCLTDDAALPSALTAVHGIPMENIEAAMPKLLATLGTTTPEAEMPGRVGDVLAVYTLNNGNPV